MNCAIGIAMNGHDHGKQILANSLRLLSDARHLLRDERYPSAAALAILSLEEFGKFITAIDFLPNPSLDKRLHVKKQSDTSLFILRFSYAIAIAEHFNIHIDLSAVSNKMVIVESDYTEVYESYLRVREKDMDMEDFEAIIQSELMSRAMRLFILVGNGDLNYMKNKALYADINLDGSVNDPSAEIDREKAKEIVELCEYVMSFFKDRILVTAKD